MKRWAIRAIDLFSIAALCYAAIRTFVVVFDPFGPADDPLVRLRESQITMIENQIAEVDRGLNGLQEELGFVLSVLNSTNPSDPQAAALAERVSVLDERVRALEETLEIDPGNAIELVRIKDEVADFSGDLEALATRTEREIDRLYTIFLSIVGALLVAVTSSILSNVFSSKERD